MDQWRQAKDPKGRVYYYNIQTRQTTWQKPANFQPSQEQRSAVAATTSSKVSLPPDWKTATTKDGKVYYYNVKTKATSWEPPPPLRSSSASQKEQRSPQQLQSLPVQTQTKTQPQSSTDSFETKYANKSLLLRQPILNTTTTSRELAETHFLEMLKQNQVDATWSFDKIINTLGKQDPRYWELPNDPIRKTQLFETYLLNRSEDQLLKESQEIAKFEAAFRALLERLAKEGKLFYYTSWKTARRRLLANESIYMHSMIGESVKRKCFEKFVWSLRAREEAEREKVKTVALEEVRDYLRSVMFSSGSSSSDDNGNSDVGEVVSWQVLAKSYLFEKNKRYMANEHFKVLSHEDVLKEYLRLLEEKQQEWQTELAELNERNYTRDRIARDRFKELLRTGLREDGIEEQKQKHIPVVIRADSSWTDIYPFVKNDPIFLSLVGRNGSNPVDLFYDIVRERQLVLDGQRSIAQQILVKEKFEWSPTKDVVEINDQLQALLRAHTDNELKGVDDYDIALLAKQLIRLHREQQREQRRLAEYKLERRVSAFKKMLLNYLKSRSDFQTAMNTLQWSDVEPLVKETPEFKSLVEEDELLLRDHHSTNLKTDCNELFEATKRELLQQQQQQQRGIKRPIAATLTELELDY